MIPNHHMHELMHIANQSGSTPVHLDNQAIKGLRELHGLVHGEEAGHDFSKLKSLFAQPNIAMHLKAQIDQKKANGGVIDDYLNTIKQHGQAGNSQLTLVPNELVKFLDDSYSLGTTNPNTGHKEFYLGKMFDGLNNTFFTKFGKQESIPHHVTVPKAAMIMAIPAFFKIFISTGTPSWYRTPPPSAAPWRA